MRVKDMIDEMYMEKVAAPSAKQLATIGISTAVGAGAGMGAGKALNKQRAKNNARLLDNEYPINNEPIEHPGRGVQLKRYPGEGEDWQGVFANNKDAIYGAYENDGGFTRDSFNRGVREEINRLHKQASSNFDSYRDHRRSADVLTLNYYDTDIETMSPSEYRDSYVAAHGRNNALGIVPAQEINPGRYISEEATQAKERFGKQFKKPIKPMVAAGAGAGVGALTGVGMLGTKALRSRKG